MDPESSHHPKTVRNICSACYKQYNKKEHLVAHMRTSYHSVHQPMCGVCRKHCKSFESLREHLTGPLAKADCAKIFTAQGCDLCLNIFDSSDDLESHRGTCRMSPVAPPLKPLAEGCFRPEMEDSGLAEDHGNRGPEVVAMDCEMVGGGSDGSLDLCARVCLIDEHENMIFHSYVKPQIPISNYRLEITGITEEHMKDAMPLKQVQEKILEILYNGESIWRTRLEGGKARVLVGHGLDHDLNCLKMNYPDHLMRDTAKYPPLMKTNLVSHSLKYLTLTYLGYEIQSGVHDPYEDCVAALRLYKRMCARDHQIEGIKMSTRTQCSNSFDAWKAKELEMMSPDALLGISRSNYRCWCLDLRPRQASKS